MSEWAFQGLAPSYDLRSGLAPWARKVDEDANDLRALLCGRRTGKTSYIAIKLCMDGLPGEVHPFVAATQQKARDILWPILERLTKSHGIRIEYNRSKGLATTDRGVKIQCMGLSTKPEVEKLRGERYPAVVFDECGALNQDLLRTAVFEAAEPATLDFAGRGGFGIICSGTPSYAPVGFWHDICGGNAGQPQHGFSVHRANVFDNPYIRNARELLAKKMIQKKWTDETPEYVREWLGQFCLSSDGLCYGKAWNGVVHDRVLRPLTGTTIIAVDFGESSPCAWTVVRCTMHVEQIGNMVHQTMRAHVLESRRQVCTSINEIAGITRQLMKAYSASWLVGDSAEGFGIRQLIQQHGLPFQRSEKSGLKAERIFMSQGMMRSGTVLIYEDCADLIEEISTVPWNEDRDDHHGAYSDHCCDSLHYALEKAFQIHQIKPAAPVPGSEEAYEQKRLEMRRKILGASTQQRSSRR
jgi:hypothetical protein